MSTADVFNLRGAAIPSGARVPAFTGREEISQTYRFEAFALISHSPLDRVCMYRESHRALFSRRVEREGLYFHFEHGEDAETLVVSDARPYAPPVGAPVRFMSSAYTRGAVEAVTHLSAQRRVTAAEVTLREYDPLNPTLDVSGHGAVDADGHGEVRRFGDTFLNPVEGRRLAGLRAQEVTGTLARSPASLAGAIAAMGPTESIEVELIEVELRETYEPAPPAATTTAGPATGDAPSGSRSGST
jgi:uncharacterized protein involved in type VI secretion and phage assembly